MRKQYTFFTTCVNCYDEDKRQKLTDMIDESIDISRKTFLAHCGASAKDVFRELGYANHWRQGLTAAGDYHISYHRSRWGNERCYYFRWSAIEHVFLVECQ